MTLPLAFQKSYRELLNYPENLIQSGTAIYSSKLKSYRKLLDDAESDLCLVSKKDVEEFFEIPIIDLETSDGTGMRQQNISSPAKLTKWLGVEKIYNPMDPNSCQIVTTKRDPKCRFIYFYGQHSRDNLKTTRSSLAEIMTYHQVMPTYLDFMLVFGAQSDPKDLRFSGFREQIQLRAPATGLSSSTLGRSGRYYQICYNLKSVQMKKKSAENVTRDDYSIRQASILHVFDVVLGTTLWIVTKGGEDLLDQYEELVGPNGRPEDKQFHTPGAAFASSLSTHLMFSHWATEDWRWYIRWQEEVLDYNSGMALHGPRGEGHAHRVYKPDDIQSLQIWQDRANEAVMVLEANTDVLKSLHTFYHDIVDRRDFPDTLKTACEDDLRTFTSQLNEIIHDFHMQTARAKLLVKLISDRKELVLQHLQSQVAERTEQLNRNLEHEAVVMRIVTIVTLIYLPATFTSTFFSTDVVKYQGQGESDGASYSSLALERWLQVTVPLTALTLFVAWSTYKMYDASRRGMTALERIGDMCNNAKLMFVKVGHEAEPVDTAHATRWVNSAPVNHTIWRSVGQLSTFLKPIRAHTRTDPSLPLHDVSNSKSGS